MSGTVPQASPGNSNSASQTSPGAQSHTSPHPPQPGIGMKPSTAPPVGALQAVQQVQAAAERQTALHLVTSSVSYGKGSPSVTSSTQNPMMASQQMQPQMEKPMAQMLPSVPNRMLSMGNVACWDSPNYTQPPQPHPSPPSQSIGRMTQGQLMGPNSIGNTVASMGPPPQVLSNPSPAFFMQRHTQALQQILKILNSPNASQQQQQVLTILKANPQIMAAIIKHKINNPSQSIRMGTQGQLMGPNSMRNTVASMGPRPQVLSNPSPAVSMQRHTQALQQLQALRLPNTPQEEQQLVRIFKANPHLMAAVIRQKTAQQRRQQRQQQQQQQQQMLINERNMIAPPQPQPHILTMHRQLQPNQFSHPQPPMYNQHSRMPISMNFGHQQGIQNDNTQFQFQQQILMQMASPTHTPMSPQHSILGHPQGPVPSPSQQQLMQVRSPPSTSVTQSPHPSLNVGTAGLAGPDQMTTSNDMITDSTNPVYIYNIYNIFF